MFEKKQYVIYKQSVTKDLYKDVIALANGNGGTIMIGYDEKGNIIGVKKANEQKKLIIEQLKICIEPFPKVQIKLFSLADKEAIKLQVQSEDFVYRRYGTIVEDLYVYNGVNKRKLTSPEEIYHFIRTKRNNYYEQVRTNIPCAYSDFSEFIGCFNQFVSKKNNELLIFNQENLLSFLHYMKAIYEEEKIMLTNLGLWLSNHCPIKTMFIQFQGYDRNAKINKIIEYKGSILSQFLKSREIISKNFYNQPAYVKEAVFEFLVNAFIHQDFRIEKDIEIHLFIDRIEIKSNGGIYGDVLSAPNSLPVRRNPNLARIFYRCGLCKSQRLSVSRIQTKFKQLHCSKLPTMVECNNQVIGIIPLNNLGMKLPVKHVLFCNYYC